MEQIRHILQYEHIVGAENTRSCPPLAHPAESRRPYRVDIYKIYIYILYTSRVITHGLGVQLKVDHPEQRCGLQRADAIAGLRIDRQLAGGGFRGVGLAHACGSIGSTEYCVINCDEQVDVDIFINLRVIPLAESKQTERLC